MLFKKKIIISFLLIFIDIVLIILVLLNFEKISEIIPVTKSVYPKLSNDRYFILFNVIFWLIISYFNKWYSLKKINFKSFFIKIIKQAFFYIFLLLSYFGFMKVEMSRKMIFTFVIFMVFVLGIINFFINLSKILNLKKSKVIIIGNHSSTINLMQFFNSNNVVYKVLKIFNTESNPDNVVDKILPYIYENNIDEIYCSLENITDRQINEFIEITDKYKIEIKFIPTDNSILTNKVYTEFYGSQPILSLKQPSLNKPINQLLKRFFDIVFSSLIIIFILSWLIPLISILIKLESKGPAFYKHYRYGLNYNKFYCYKFRSLKNENYDVLNQVKKKDKRLTKIGKFIRKTSIDEIPQFINVFIGNMSVVGPRPHMIPYANLYAKYFDKYNYIYRHSVKPGITGLAQVKGYRGETKSKEDIVNRIKYDIFYIENWNFYLDLKIIYLTVKNAIKGEEKAY